MNKQKLLSAIVCATMLWAGCSGSQQSNQQGSQDNSQTPTVESKSVPATAENLWKAYLKSDYCDVANVDVDAALKELTQDVENISTLTLNPFNSKVVPKVEPEPAGGVDEDSDGFESDDSVLGYYNETLAAYPVNDNESLVLAYSMCYGNGRQVLQVLKFKDGKLTRLKNSFPPFGENTRLKDLEDFNNDKFAKLNGTEAWYFDYDFSIVNFTAFGFTLAKNNEPVDQFNWSGDHFNNHNTL